MSYTTIILIALCALLVLSAFFSATETAFLSASKAKLKNRAAEGKKSARWALQLLDNYDKLISTILIGNNIVNIVASSLATLFFVELLGSNRGVSAATVVMTLSVLLFGEITPKTLAREAPESFAAACAPLIRLFIILLTPFNFLAVRWKMLLMKAFRVQNDRAITEAELRFFVEEVREDGGINEQEEVMIKRTIDFDEIPAYKICTPRVDLAAVSTADSVEDIDRTFRETRFSRLPVYENSIDNIIGVLLLKDFHCEGIGEGRTVRHIMKSVLYIPQAIKAGRLLKMLQEKKSHLAVIIDEFGGTMGIVTIEDIVEELVGEIWDEHDEVIQTITELEGQRFLVLGRAQLSELASRFSIAGFAETETTLANWLLEKSGGEARVGEVFSFYGMPLTISKVRRNTVVEAVLEAPETTDGAAGGGGADDKAHDGAHQEKAV